VNFWGSFLEVFFVFIFILSKGWDGTFDTQTEIACSPPKKPKNYPPWKKEGM
jgi:hypothetical protein